MARVLHKHERNKTRLSRIIYVLLRRRRCSMSCTGANHNNTIRKMLNSCAFVRIAIVIYFLLFCRSKNKKKNNKPPTNQAQHQYVYRIVMRNVTTSDHEYQFVYVCTRTWFIFNVNCPLQYPLRMEFI